MHMITSPYLDLNAGLADSNSEATFIMAWMSNYIP